MKERKEILEEQLLRENIRRAIRIVQQRSEKKEESVRHIVRHLIKEASTFKYEYTALNLLAHFIKETVGDPSKPDSNPAFKDAFTDLTSSTEDREMFTEFILDFANEDFKTMDADKQPKALGQDFVQKGFIDDDEEIEIEEEPADDEVIKVSVSDIEDNGGDLSPSEEEEEEITLGEDGEGVEIEEETADSGIKIYSREAYKRVGPSLRRYYMQIEKDSPLKKGVSIDGRDYEIGELSERDLFQIYFRKNLQLWAGRYEEEFFNNSPESEIDIEASNEPPEAEGGEMDLGL